MAAMIIPATVKMTISAWIQSQNGFIRARV
jgi:hypothetical protein